MRSGKRDAHPEGLPEALEPLHCLGEGGMGSVWSVRDRRTGRVGALKAIRPGLLTDQAIVRRFEREMRTCAQLSHPYVVQILDVGRLQTGAPYMLMEQIDGVPLIDLDLQGRTLGELVRLFDRILSALGYAHARRIIHRDLKPDNVLVYTDELGELIPKLMDFGLAMVAIKGQLATRLTADGMVVGTPAYMAPEQACDEHHKICPATDLYAFGCMLYELLCGSPPHVAASPMSLLLAHATKPPRPFVPLPTIERGELLEPLVMRLLEKDPEDRYEFAADVRQELRESGLLDADDDVDPEPIGRYGDTLVAMPALRPETLAAFAEDAEDAAALETGDGDVLSSRDDVQVVEPVAALERPPEADFQVSVLNLREPSLVGRVEARNTLQRYVEDVRQVGQAAVCLVSGPTGIGKSRLVRWLVEDGETRGALRYLRVSVAAGSSASLSVLLAVVNHLRLKGLSHSQCEQALLRFFRTEDSEDWRVTGFRALVEQRDGMSSSGSSMNTTLSRLDLLLYAALERLAEGRPLVLWLDDTSSSGPQSVRKLVASIASRQKTRPAPILMLVIDRAELDMPSDLELAVGNLEQAWLRSGVHLAPLSVAEMFELTHEGLHLAPRLARHVVRQADGLPLLAVALARQWHAAGLLESTPEGFLSRIELSRLPVPEAVQTVLLMQLELSFRGIGREMWEPVAQLAAVLGRTFSERALTIALPVLPLRLPALDAHRFVEQTLADGVLRLNDDGLYEFSSALMREGLLTTLAAERLADLHRAAAHAKAREAERQPALFVEVARHLLAGRAYVEAYEAYVRAARDAYRHGRLDDARQYLDAAQEALANEEGLTGPWDARVASVWELELEIELASGDRGRALERLGWLGHVCDRLDDPLWRPRVLRAEALVALDGNDLPRARAHLEAGVARLDELAAHEGLDEARRDLVRAQLLVELARFEGADEALLERATQSARACRQPDVLARALLVQGQRALAESLHARARDRLTEALACATDAGDLRTEASVLSNLAELAIALEDHEQAEKLLYSASRCHEALGDLDVVAACHRRLAELARSLGREGDARNHERWLELISG